MLRYVLLSLVLIAPLLGCTDYARTARHRKIMKTIEDVGGYVELGDDVEIDENHFCDDVITFINLDEADLSAIPFPEVFPLESMQGVVVRGNELNDLQVREIATCANLEEVSIPYTKVTDKSVASLRDLKKLSQLFLNGCNVTDACIDDLLAMENLKTVGLSETYVTQAGIDRLLTHPGLEEVYWDQVPSEEIRQLICSLGSHGIVVSRDGEGHDDDCDKPLVYLVDMGPRSTLDDSAFKLIDQLAEKACLKVMVRNGETLSRLSEFPPLLEINLSDGAFSEVNESFDARKLTVLSAKKVVVYPYPCSLKFQPELVKIKGLQDIELLDVEMDPATWEALINAPQIQRIALELCRFSEFEKFSVPKREIELVFKDTRAFPDEEKMIEANILRLQGKELSSPDENAAQSEESP